MATLFERKTWHWKPTMYLTCTYTATRANEKTPTVHYKFDFTNIMGSDGSYYGASNALGISVTVDGATTSGYIIGNKYNDNSGTIEFDRTNTSTTGSSGVSIYIWCHQGTYANPTGTSNNCTASSGSKYTDIGGLKSRPYHGTWEGTVYYPVYNPYTPSTIWLNPGDYTKIGRVDSSSWSVHYSYNSGSNTNCPISLAIHDYGAVNWGVRWEPVIRYITGSSDGVWDSVKLSSAQGFTHGNRYRITLVSNGGEALSPSSWNPQDGLVIYTYQEPKINTGLTRSRATQHANQDNTFSISGTNGRAWSSYENPFQTHYRIKRGSGSYSGWTNLGDITTWSRTAAEMRSLVPKDYDGQTITIDMKRFSPTPSWYSSNTASNTFTVYYRPRVGISSASFRKNNSSGTTVSGNNYVIDDSSLTHVYISWSYDTNSVNAGYTQGYRIRLYNSAGNVVKTYYTTSKSYSIPKADIPRIQQTYIDITPYYANDSTNTSSYWYYNGTISKINFVRIVGNIGTPTITYPINNSTWVNKDFRVCFQLPIDPDKGNEPETYHYENVEININGNYTIRMTDSAGQTTSGTCVKSDNGPFSAKVANLTYQRKLVIYPNALGSMPTASNGKYSIKVRVKKKYGTSSSQTLWSPWSSIVNVTVSTPSFSPSKEGFIYASHFNNVRTLVNNIRNAYGVGWSNIPGTASSDNTIISRSQYYYSVMLTKLNETKNQINGYTTSYDVTKPKVDTANAIPTSFTTSNEHITAATSEDNSPDTPVGKNYIKIIYEKAILLK